MPMWRNGRRDGLKIRSGQLGVGSNPTIGTNFKAKYTYNASGIRTSKAINVNMLECNCGKENCDCNGTFTTTFFLNGNKIIKQHDCCNDLTFYYAADGITGFHLKNNMIDADFYYKKNAQNDIIGIYSTSGDEIVRYEYDAWGNCSAKYLTSNNEYAKITSDYTYNDTTIINRFIAFKNPFRYRSYYYDFETNLYYLNSRYYDPETGRFINADDINYADAESGNGLNLYAYCVNNPINFTDENGHAWWDWLVSIFVAIAVIVAIVVVSVVTAGIGTAIAGALGGGVAATIFGSAIGGAITGAITGAIMSFGISVISQGLTVGYSNINWGQVGIDTLIGAASGLASGAIFGAISGTVKVMGAAKSWAPTSRKSALKVMSEHYKDHVIKEGQQHIVKNILNYTKQAKAFYIANSANGYKIGVNAIKIAGAPGGIFTMDGLIKSFWYILK